MLCYPAVEKPLVHRKGVWGVWGVGGICVCMCVHVPVSAALHKAVMGP